MKNKKILIRSALIIISFLLLLLLFAQDYTIRGYVKTNVKAVRWEPTVQAFNKFGDGGIQAVITIIILIAGYFKKKANLIKTGKYGLIAIIAAGIAVQIIKRIIGRPRPTMMDAGIKDIGPSISIGLDSYPSGHTASSFALAAVLSSAYPKGRYIFISLQVLQVCRGYTLIPILHLMSLQAPSSAQQSAYSLPIRWQAAIKTHRIHPSGKWQAT